jgi:hypothetical protein
MPFKDKEKARENQRERNRRYRAKHPVISAERRKADYYRDLEKSRERARKWYWANREKALAAANERSQRVRYQVPQVLLDMLGNACKICGATEANKKGYKLHIDHDHETGTIRGKLCNGCNSGIGYFKESPELLRKAADYLEWAARV